MRAVGLMYAVRANKSDQNLTDQISGQSFDDHVEQFNSRSPLRPAAFTRAISLAVGCVRLAADFSLTLSLSVVSSFTVQFVVPTFDSRHRPIYSSTLVRLRGVRSLPLNDRSSAGGCTQNTGGYVQNP